MSYTADLINQEFPIEAQQYALLEQLSNACAVSGGEQEVRAIVLEQVRPLADKVKVDALGNVLVIHAGKEPGRLRVMLAAHMDEVGLMLVDDEKEGIFRFETVGGIDPRHLVGQAVWVGKEHIPGVIGARPIHLSSREERRRAFSFEDLRIDIGPGGNTGIRIGDWATFATRFYHTGPSLVGKALDNRLGVAILIELLRRAPDNIDLLLAFTVQEEVGLRGAQAAAYALAPDAAFAVDCTPARDLPAWDGSENTQYNTRLGAGPAIYLADGHTISDPRLVRHLATTAEQEGIPYQYRQPGGGGTDAGAIHQQLSGIPSVSISVPGRYAHSPASIARAADWTNTLRLLQAALLRLTPAVLQR
jgi:putative aminopeptidase FrvX